MTADDWDDFDDSDDEGSSTVTCPACGRAIYHDAEQCPHCGEYVLEDELSDGSSPAWKWLCRVVVVLLLIVFLGPVFAMLVLAFS